ncbi:MAG: tRNA (guanosine(37)-N1)-methyltransferase TrmD [Opitutales bacterium]
MPIQVQFDVISLFPSMLDGIVKESIIGRAISNELIEVRSHDLRNWTTDKHNVADDRPFGGGPGMVLKPEPLFAAIEELRGEDSEVVYMAPDGETLARKLCEDLSTRPHLVLISGHYEGIDQRVRDQLVTQEISIGDFVLTNGTLAAAILIDAVSRFVPGVLGEDASLTQDSFASGRLSFPQYTRPVEFRGVSVPEVLLSGNHEAIRLWRHEQAERKTRNRRPDLIS